MVSHLRLLYRADFWQLWELLDSLAAVQKPGFFLISESHVKGYMWKHCHTPDSLTRMIKNGFKLNFPFNYIRIRSHDFFGSLWKGPAPTGCNCRVKQLVAAACCGSMASWNCFCLFGQAEFKKRQPSGSSTLLAWKSLMKKWHETTTLAISRPFCLRVCILGAVLNTHCSHRLCLRIGWGDKI